jgi:hypothetical protein
LLIVVAVVVVVIEQGFISCNKVIGWSQGSNGWRRYSGGR